MDESYQATLPRNYHYNSTQYGSAFNPVHGSNVDNSPAFAIPECFDRNIRRPNFQYVDQQQQQPTPFAYDEHYHRVPLNFQYRPSYPLSLAPNRSVAAYLQNLNTADMSAMDRHRKTHGTLQRQHRSLEGMELICDYGESGVAAGGSGDWSTNTLMRQLNVAVNSNPQNHTQSAPISNPINSSSYFWKQNIPPHAGQVVPSAAMCDPCYNPGLQVPLSDVQLRHAYAVLKKEYENAVEKLNTTMNSIKTFWSPELKRERLLRKEESCKFNVLKRQMDLRKIGGNTGTSSIEASNLKRELESCQYELGQKEERIRRLKTNIDHSVSSGIGSNAAHLAELEMRCDQLETMLDIRDQQLRSMEQQNVQLSFQAPDSMKDRHIADLEEELTRLRLIRRDMPRDFTDKSVSSQELNTIRMKLERSEVELAQKSTELSSVQARLQSAMDEKEELRKHLAVLRQSITAKEKHSALLQGDIEALRVKLETKNTQLQHKEKTIEQLGKDLKGSRDRMADMREANKSLEQRIGSLVARLDGLEKMVREKDAELDMAKRELLSHPNVQQERSLKLQIEEANREKLRMQSLIDDVRRNAEKEKSEQLLTFKENVAEFNQTIEGLQKELADRQILLESQNEKIGDLDKQLMAWRDRSSDTHAHSNMDGELLEARKEIESLLRMVQNLEKEKASLISQSKQLQSIIDEIGGDSTGLIASIGSHRTETLPKLASTDASLKGRIEELEEALRESVSITAEREFHVAQQKQINQQLIAQLSKTRHELSELRRNVSDTASIDRDEMVRRFEAERRQHLEQLLQLKHEALIAAIAEKDAHIALLEQSRDKPRDEIETLRYHKEKLIEKLKEENERRSQLFHSSAMNVAVGGPIQQSQSSSTLPPVPLRIAHIASTAIMPSLSAPPTLSAQLSHLSSNPLADQDDDAEGIWA